MKKSAIYINKGQMQELSFYLLKKDNSLYKKIQNEYLDEYNPIWVDEFELKILWFCSENKLKDYFWEYGKNIFGWKE
jgi:hypothetical protein